MKIKKVGKECFILSGVFVGDTCMTCSVNHDQKVITTYINGETDEFLTHENRCYSIFCLEKDVIHVDFPIKTNRVFEESI